MPRQQSGAPGLHLETARDRVGGSRTAWCADYWRRECPALGWWWRVSQRSYIPSQPYEIAKNGEKAGDFAHVLAYNSPKTPFFALKYLTRYTHETFFEEHTNFEGIRVNGQPAAADTKLRAVNIFNSAKLGVIEKFLVLHYHCMYLLLVVLSVNITPLKEQSHGIFYLWFSLINSFHACQWYSRTIQISFLENS